MLLEILHIGQPFDQEETVYAVDIPGQVGIIGLGEAGEFLPRHQLLGQVEESLQEGCETVVFDQLGIFKQGEEESLMVHEECMQIVQGNGAGCRG